MSENFVERFLDEHQRSIRMAAQVLSGIISDPALPAEKQEAGRTALTAIYEGAQTVKEIVDATPDAIPNKAEAKAIAKRVLARGAMALIKRIL